MFSTDLLMQVMRIPGRFLGMMILTFSLIGVYSLRNSLTDCAVAAAFGVFGVILRRLELPTSPIILGIVLGRLMEDKLRTAMARVKTPFEFIDRPIAFILFVMIVLVIGLHIYTVVRARRQQRESRTDTVLDA
jgi:putative tricarboxylic transport membrane protein